MNLGKKNGPEFVVPMDKCYTIYFNIGQITGRRSHMLGTKACHLLKV